MGNWNGWHMVQDWGWGGMALGCLVMLIFWAAVIALTVYAVRRISQGGRTAPSNDYAQVRQHSSLDVLKERYARGEITREEYLNIKQDLET